MINLRPYQEKYISEIRNRFKKDSRRVIMSAPTGSGKTYTFSTIIGKSLEKGKKCLILSHRIELMKQTGGALYNLGYKTEVIDADNKNPDLVNKNLYTSMAQTLTRRIKKDEYIIWLKSLSLIVIDEAHEGSANFIWDYIKKYNIKCYVIGATATPIRKGNQWSFHTFYDSIVECVSIQELINKRFLCEPEYYSDRRIANKLNKVSIKAGDYDNKEVGNLMDELKTYEGVLDNYEKHCKGDKTLIFSSSIDSSINLVDEFNDKGFDAKHLDYKSKKGERKEILNWFDKTNNAILSNVGILSTGFDQPDIKSIMIYRATMSVPLFLQMCGRGSRINENKTKFKVLDFGNNFDRLGYWHEDRKWKLRHKHKKGDAPSKDCPECGAVLAVSIKFCPYCGHEFVNEEKEPEEIIELRKISYKELVIRAQNNIKEYNFEELEKIAKARGYKMGWILHQFNNPETIYKYANYKGYKRYWADKKIEYLFPLK